MRTMSEMNALKISSLRMKNARKSVTLNFFAEKRCTWQSACYTRDVDDRFPPCLPNLGRSNVARADAEAVGPMRKLLLILKFKLS